MALDRWIAFFILMICLIYGYTAFFTMDAGLPPVLQRNPIWPSSFPKVLSVCAIFIASIVVLGLEKTETVDTTHDIDLTRLGDYNGGQAIALLALMAAYALLLRPLGFIGSTFLFLSCGSFILGEKRFVIVALVASIATGSVWYLVDQVLGIFLVPLPTFLMGY